MIVVTMEGILRNKQNVVNTPMVRVINALSEALPVIVLADTTAKEASMWLKMNGVLYARIVGTDITRRSETLRYDQIAVVKSKGVLVALIDPDPLVAAWALAQGIPTFVYLHPQYSRPEFRPDATRMPVPWETVLNELAYQQEALLSDSRLNFENESYWEE